MHLKRIARINNPRQNNIYTFLGFIYSPPFKSIIDTTLWFVTKSGQK